MLRRTELGVIYIDGLETAEEADEWANVATKRSTIEIDSPYGGGSNTHELESISPDPKRDGLEYVLRAQRNCSEGLITLDTRFTHGFKHFSPLIDEFTLKHRDAFFYRTSNHPYLDRYVDLRQFISQIGLKHHVNKNEIKRLLGEHAKILVTHDDQSAFRHIVIDRTSFDSFVYTLSRPPYSSKGFLGFFKSGFAHDIKTMMHFLKKHSNW